jgi:hypothetical protein
MREIVLPDKHFQNCLIFTRIEAYIRTEYFGLPAVIRLGCTGMPGANTLTYFASLPVTKKKVTCCMMPKLETFYH